MPARTQLHLGLVLIFLLILSAFILEYLAIWPFADFSAGQPVYLKDRSNSESVVSAEPDQRIANAKYISEIVVKGLEIPWSIVFTSKDRVLVAERPGRIRQVLNEQLAVEPLYEFEEIVSRGEAGLMGMTADPGYDNNKYLYVCMVVGDDNGLKAQVRRLKDEGKTLSSEEVIVDNIPAAANHAGCELAFGPDDKLYITTGDASEGEIAQDLESLGGKILRVNSDGTIPEDNPFPDSMVWSYGHRNAQGIDWYPNTDILYAAEHGPSGFDGPGGGDEINIIKTGENYGWPRVSHQNSAPGMVSPKVVFTPAIAPSSIVFYGSENIPQFRNNLFSSMLIGEGIMRLVISHDDPEEIVMYEKLPLDDYGRIRDLAMGPDGNLYFSTSNQDGRGEVREGDDKIVRIIPE